MASIRGLKRHVGAWRATAAALHQARGIDISGVRSVGLFLGPYRNLTTLTAAVLFLHPHCQVLNHAGRRIFQRHRLDFLARYDEATFDHFVRYAIHQSAGGQRGAAGGSITHSHAFTGEYKVRDIFESSGNDLVKSDIRSLVWKESLATANHIRSSRADLDAIFETETRLRFLVPVRHPIDAAISNVTKHFAGRFEGLTNEASVEQVIDAILDEYLWVQTLRVRHPERFFVFFEHSTGRDTLAALARFLELEPLDSWLDPATEAFEVKARYDHPQELVERLQAGVESRFADHPDFADGLRAFR
jgi:hypothetical protein